MSKIPDSSSRAKDGSMSSGAYPLPITKEKPLRVIRPAPHTPTSQKALAVLSTHKLLPASTPNPDDLLPSKLKLSAFARPRPTRRKSYDAAGAKMFPNRPTDLGRLTDLPDPIIDGFDFLPSSGNILSYNLLHSKDLNDTEDTTQTRVSAGNTPQKTDKTTDFRKRASQLPKVNQFFDDSPSTMHRNLRTKTPPHKLDLLQKVVLGPNKTDFAIKLSDVEPKKQLPVKSNMPLGLGKLSSRSDVKGSPRNDLRGGLVSPKAPKVIENGLTSRPSSGASNSRQDSAGPLYSNVRPKEFVLDIPEDKACLFDSSERPGSSKKGCPIPPVKSRFQPNPKLISDKASMTFPSKTPSLQPKPLPSRPDTTPPSHSKPDPSIPSPTVSRTAKVSSSKVIPPKKKASSKVTPATSPNNPPHNIIEWITSSVVTIPPVFKASVESSKQPGFFMVASNTHNGITRCYNEDRVKITTVPDQIRKRKISGGGTSPDTLALFSIFDGHGSYNCSQFLNDRLHTAILDRVYPDFSKLPSIVRLLYHEIDSEFRKFSVKIKENFAGSCAVTLVVFNKTLYAINLGDSRCIVSKNSGSEVHQLTFDHKPSEQVELERVVAAGGHVFRVIWDAKKRIEVEQRTHNIQELEALQKQDRKKKDNDFGPWRVSPGGLSVSRCFGDFECKGGANCDQPNVVSTDPGVYSVSTDDLDFAMIGCEFISGWNLRRTDQRRSNSSCLEDYRRDEGGRHQTQTGGGRRGVL